MGTRVGGARVIDTRVGGARVMGTPARIRRGQVNLQDDRQPAVQQQRGGREPADQALRASRTAGVTPSPCAPVSVS
jgi:hypothetical protein